VKFSVRRKPFDLLDLTPLIDVVFLLLIFFMVSTTFIHEPGGIKVDLPHSDTQEFIRESGEVVVEITENGGLFVDDVPVDEAALRAALRRTMRADPESVVIIKADRGVEHGRVVQVMDWSKRAGLYRLAVATEGSRLQRPLRDAGGSQ
jgi:biopolymer transport protein ExbD